MELSPNQNIVCAEHALGTDLTPYDWFTNSNYWEYSPNTNFSLGAYGGVQVNGIDQGYEEYLPYNVDFISGVTTDCPYVLIAIEVGSSSYINNGNTITLPFSVGEYEIASSGIHWVLYPSDQLNNIQFDFEATGDIAQILNISIYCPEMEADCDCKFGDYCQPVLFQCETDSSTTASLMAAIKTEWLAEASTYESPSCVGDTLEALEAIEVEDCTITSESMTVQYAANYSSNVVLNGTFDSSANWSLGGKMSIGSGTLNTTPGAGVGVATQACLTVGKWYKLTFTISGWSAGDIDVRFGNGNTVATVGGNEAFTVYGQCLNTVDFAFDCSSSDTFDGKIDNVVALEAMPAMINAITESGELIESTIEFDRLEEDVFFQRFTLGSFGSLKEFKRTCFRMWLFTPKSSSSDLCITQKMCVIDEACNTLLLYAQMENSGNAYGWQFPDPSFVGIFAPRMRVWGELKDAQYPAEKTTYQDSQGTKNVVWAEVRETKTLVIDRSPEYVHDFVSLAINTDLFRIIEGDSITDAIYFNRADSYAPSWIRISKLAPASVEVEVKTQNLEKNLCN